MNAELIDQITILNKHVAELTQKSQDLINVIKETKGLDIDTILTGIVGIVGVLIGAYISYRFTKHVTEESSKARFAIQRKNLIYSKLYKELIYMKEQISLLPENGFYFQIMTNVTKTYTYTYGYNHFYSIGNSRDYIAAEFYQWKNIKSDIRLTQVNSQISEVMFDLEKNIIIYFQNLNKFTKDIEMAKRNNQISSNIDHTDFLYKNFNKDEYLEDSFIGDQNFKDNVEYRERFKICVETIMDSTYLKELSTDFTFFINSLHKADNLLKDLIKKIITKYEYGEQI